MKKYYIESRGKGISYIQYKAELYGFVGVVTAFYETLLKERYKGRTDEEHDVSSCWMTLKEMRRY